MGGIGDLVEGDLVKPRLFHIFLCGYFGKFLKRPNPHQALVCAMHDAAHLFQTEVETMKRQLGALSFLEQLTFSFPRCLQIVHFSGCNI